MPFILNTGTGLNGHPEEVQIYYQEVGHGNPVVLIHGWPLNLEMWEYQFNELPKHNIRVIAYDRRGFGKSSKPWEPYTYDAFAQDLNALLETLDLYNVTLVGFSMGGGEVARFLSKYNTSGRVTKAAFVSAVTPFLLKTENNPEGLPQEQFDGIKQQLENDRAHFLAGFGKQFYGVHLFSNPVSAERLQQDATLALQASGYATIKAMEAWSATDFREDLSSITIPTLIIHGKADETVPIDISGDKTAASIPHADYVVFDDAPHGLVYTHKDKFNEEIIRFINS